jgi:hypothetical protein
VSRFGRNHADGGDLSEQGRGMGKATPTGGPQEAAIEMRAWYQASPTRGIRAGRLQRWAGAEKDGPERFSYFKFPFPFRF